MTEEPTTGPGLRRFLTSSDGWPYVLVPFIPGVRSIPRLIPIHRLIWRDYYRNQA